jgi:glycosyltransferase EpsE
MFYFDENGIFGRGRAKEGEVSKNVFNYGTPFCHAPCMVRKEAYDKVGGYTVDKRLLRVEDYELWVKMYAAGYKGYNLGEHLYSMRDDKNAVARRTIKGRMNVIYAHWLAYKRLNLSFFKFVKVATITFAKAFTPTFIYNYFHKKNLNR